MRGRGGGAVASALSTSVALGETQHGLPPSGGSGLNAEPALYVLPNRTTAVHSTNSSAGSSEHVQVSPGSPLREAVETLLS